MSRPHFQTSTAELKKMAENASPELLEEILEELSHRRKPGARALEAELNRRLGREEATPGNGASIQRGPKPRPRSADGTTAGNGAEPYPKHSPTDEQDDAIAAFKSGDSLKVCAFAGAGKTSTLQFMALERRARGIYLAFNRSIAQEAREDFPSWVDTRTTHSLALRLVRGLGGYKNAKLFDRCNANQLADLIGAQELSVDKHIRLERRQVAHMQQQAVRRFCSSSDGEVQPRHVSLVGRLSGAAPAVQDEVRQWVATAASALWARMVDADDPVPLGHDGYLKLWSLKCPRLDYDFILLDEAQDTNPAVLSVLQGQESAQLVYVGDRHQQIYEWRGAINAMSTIDTTAEVKLTQSFRFGREIAQAATAVLRTLGEPVPLVGFDKISSRIASGEATRTVLARTNATVIEEALRALSRDQVPHIVGDLSDLKAMLSDVFKLQDGLPGSHPDFFGFTNWQQVVDFADSEEGADLRQFVSLVVANGPRKLWAAINSSIADESAADIVISTAHRSKGRQWPSVRIASDFVSSQTEEGEVTAAEARLFYVVYPRTVRALSRSRASIHFHHRTGSRGPAEQAAYRPTTVSPRRHLGAH